MPDDPLATRLTPPARKLPASLEAPDGVEPPGAGGLEADARISYERPAGIVVAKPEVG